MRPFLLRSMATVALSILLLTACGGDDGGGDGGGGDAGSGSETPSGSPAPEGVDGVLAFDIGDRDHVEGAVDYPMRPPVAGNHNPVWANCGFYDGEVPDENAVHSLEHGAVWVAYADDLADDQVQALAGLAAANDHVLVSRYPGLGSPVVLTAWNRQLAVDTAGDPQIPAFVSTYANGPTAPEVDADCAGGAG